MFYNRAMSDGRQRSIRPSRSVSNRDARFVRNPEPAEPLAMDRRVRRTRALLHRSLIQLILEKGYSKITVQDILDRADVGRSTFYAHFRSKDDLLVNGWEDARASFAEKIRSSSERAELLEPMLVFFQHIDGQRQLYRAMVGKQGSELVDRAIRKLLSEMVEEHLRSRVAGSGRAEERLELAVQFVVGGLIGLITWWLDTEAPFTADEMHASFQKLATHGVERYLTERTGSASAQQG
jgi:AcrR family transcriptional regulator